MKVVLKSVWSNNGELFVMICGVQLMPAWLVSNLDTLNTVSALVSRDLPSIRDTLT